MSDCDRFHELIERRLGGDVTAADTAALREHCRGCRDCRRLCAADELLRDAALAVEPDVLGLAEVRRAVLRQARQPGSRPAERFSPGWRPRWAVAGAGAAAAALFLLGFLAGRRGGPAAMTLAAQDAPVVRGFSKLAQAAQPIRDPLDSPFTYANVRFEPGEGSGRLRLGCDVSAHLDLERRIDDPLVAEVVVQTLRNGTSSLGSRLKAMAVASRLADPRVRSALVAVLHEDPSPAVRLEALAALASPGRGASDLQVRAAVLQALRNESSMQVRLLAVDYLAASGVDRASLLRAAESGPEAMREALVVRASQDLARQ
jgi:hypothetical protein